MSIPLYGGGILDNRGSIGGTTFSRSRGGATARAKTSPINQQTTFQGTSRSRLQGISNMWSQVLTEPERAAWNSFALINPTTNVFGQTTYLSGQNWFVKLSLNTLNTGGTIVTTPPIAGSYPGLTSLTLTAVGGGLAQLRIDFTGPTFTGTPYLYIFATNNISAGTFYASNKFRFIETLPLPIVTFHDFLGGFRTRFNADPITGMKIFCLVKMIDQDSGIDSPGIIASAIVT